jgi:hypothetical protein
VIPFVRNPTFVKEALFFACAVAFNGLAAGTCVAASLSIDISSPRAQIVEGEPLQLVVTATNNSSQAISFSKHSTYFHAYFSTDCQNYTKFENWELRGLSPATNAALQPGESWQFDMWLAYNFYSLQRISTAPVKPTLTVGNYSIRVAHAYMGQRTDSNVIQVKVTSPVGRDKEALAILHDKDFLYFLQLGRLPKGREDYVFGLCEKLRTTFGETHYLRSPLVQERLSAIQGRSSTDHKTSDSSSQTPLFTIRDIFIGVVVVGLSIYLALHIRKRRSLRGLRS